MGTSTHNPGQNGHTPLVPSWVDSMETDEITYEQPNTEMEDLPSIPTDADQNRFSFPRSEMTRYTHSGGSDMHHAKKGISYYISHSTGGSANATKRLGASRKATASLFAMAGVFSSGGVTSVERFFSVDNLAGLSADAALIKLSDLICPDGGTTNEGIARNAYFEAIAEIPELAETQFENITVLQLKSLIIRFMAGVINSKIINDIDNKLIRFSEDISSISKMQEQMQSFIEGAISDSINKCKIDFERIDQSQVKKIVDDVYRTAFEIMRAIGDEE